MEIMKKMIIFMPKMSMGGMERSLANLLKMSNYSKQYKITLIFGYIDEDTLFKDLPDNIEVKVMYKNKKNLLGKMIMTFNFLKMKILMKNEYDISICYSHHHAILAELARKASGNSIVFIHSDLKLARTKKQINKMKFNKFAKVVCVSESTKKSFIELFPNYDSDNIYVINNYIDGEKIIKLSKEDVNIKKSSDIVFINVARHLESAKRITRIVDAADKLKKEGCKFKVLLAGDGPDHTMYKELIKKHDLEDTIILLGNVSNPYKYMRIADAFILSSSFEGYGMVIDEARTLEIPVISTNVADSETILNQGYGIICENSELGVYKGMKEFLQNGYKMNQKFNYNQFNDNISKSLDKLVRF